MRAIIGTLGRSQCELAANRNTVFFHSIIMPYYIKGAQFPTLELKERYLKYR